ncbi:hypothetical protein EU546_04180 [Candidatus Thorarchaeota archaeon]|nr:MAG: hypothetical protein EU546_04180 [Candidatus Thorarchaeota archaeon]
MMQESQLMFTVSLPAIFALLILIALVLHFMGVREQTDMVKKSRLMRMGGSLLGFTIILVGVLWYATRIGFSGYAQMGLEDIVLLTVLSSIGGIIIGFSARM